MTAPHRDNVSRRLVVVLPTYRRPGPLAWSLASVLHQELASIQPCEPHLVVVNNDLETAPVDNIVRRITDVYGTRGWQLQVVHRNPPMEPALSWYDALRSFTREGDILFFSGDDDLLMPRSVAVRASMLLERDAVMLMSTSQGGLYFDDGRNDGDTRACFADCALAETRPEPCSPLPAREFCAFASIFIGNHAFRNTAMLWEAYDAARELMRLLPGDAPDKHSMLPDFLTLCLVRRSAVVKTQACGAIRGMQASAVLGSGSGRIQWQRPGYYNATALYLLSQMAREEAVWRDMRDKYLRLTREWYALSSHVPEYREIVRELGGLRLFASSGGLRDLAKGYAFKLRYRLNIHNLSARKKLAVAANWKSLRQVYPES